MKNFVLIALALIVCVAIAGCGDVTLGDPKNAPITASEATKAPLPTTAPASGCQFASSPEQASQLYTNGKGKFERSAEGGWHMIEQPFRQLVTPNGCAFEGYYDTKPGKDPRQFVAVVAIEAQGGTIWPASPADLWCAMAGQKKYTVDQAKSLIDAVGFNAPSTCSRQ